MPIRIEVNTLGYLKDLYPHLSEVAIVESEEPLTVLEIIGRLGVSSRMVLFVTIDDRIVPRETLVEEACSLNLISPPAGG
jgi:sulfur carrier protein ThiS